MSSALDPGTRSGYNPESGEAAVLAPAVEGDLLSSADAAVMLGVSLEQVAELAGDGSLATAALSVGGTRLFRRIEVEELAGERTGRELHHHAVQFFESDAYLCGVVARFAARGLRAGAGAALFLTAEHLRGVREQLAADGVDVATALAERRLHLFDAHVTLDGFMHRGLVDANAFVTLVQDLLARSGAKPTSRLRAVGEMVDLLWKEGLPDAALHLERLWDPLTRSQPVSLLCAYHMENFRVGGDAAPFDDICAVHTRVGPTERFRQDDVIDTRHRVIAQLQQRARALESELPRRARAEQLVREREEELRRQNEALTQALRAKDEFLAMLGHELRNPLAPILLAVDLLRQRFGEADEHAVIDRQVKHLVHLVDDLLDVARLVRGKVQLQPQRVELAQVIARGVELASGLIEARRDDLELHVAPLGLQLELDVERMAQVVANVLGNAAKYSDPGTKIAVAARLDGERVRLSIQDHGIGIEPALLERVFELFAQESPSLDRSSGGLGLGLAIARKIVALHGGEISAHSAGSGQGTELRVVLPLRVAAQAAQPQPGQAASAAPEPSAHGARPAGHARRRVLLVDDNEDAAVLLGRVVENLGHEVALAHDGPAALEQAERFVPEVALLDLGLPGLDGYEVGARLRALNPDLRLIAISGYGDDRSRARSAATGFEAHLVKPVSAEQLAALLR